MSERHIHPLCLVLDYRCVLCLVWSVKYLPTFTTILSMITSFYVFMQEAREPDRLFCHWEDINTGSTFMNGAAQDGTTLRCRTTHTLLTLPVGRSLCATPSWVFFFFFRQHDKVFLYAAAGQRKCMWFTTFLTSCLLKHWHKHARG